MTNKYETINSLKIKMLRLQNKFFYGIYEPAYDKNINVVKYWESALYVVFYTNLVGFFDVAVMVFHRDFGTTIFFSFF